MVEMQLIHEDYRTWDGVMLVIRLAFRWYSIMSQVKKDKIVALNHEGGIISVVLPKKGSHKKEMTMMKSTLDVMMTQHKNKKNKLS